jgi:WD40 repeat protein
MLRSVSGGTAVMHRFILAAIALTVAPGLHARQASDARLQSLQTELVLDTNGRVAACDSLLFSPDGKHLLATGDDKLVRSWQWTGSKLIREDPCRWSIFREQRGSIYSMALSPDGKRLAVGGFGLRDGSAAVFDRTTREVAHGTTRTLMLGRQQGTIWGIAFSTRGDRIAYGTDDGHIWLWDPAQTEPRKALRRLGNHPPVNGTTNKVRLILFRHADRVISVAEDGWVMEWDTQRDGAEPNRLFRFETATNLVAVAFDPKHQRLAAAGQRKNPKSIEIRGLDGSKGPLLETPGERAFPNCLAFDPAGDRLAVGTYTTAADAPFYKITEGAIFLYDLKGEPRVSPGPPNSWYPEALAFHPTENVLAVAGGNDHEVAVFDLSKPPKTPIAEVKGPGMCLWGVGVARVRLKDNDGQRNAFLLGVQPKRLVDPVHPNFRGTGPWHVFDLEKRRWGNEYETQMFRPAPNLDTIDGWKLAPDPRDGMVWYVFSPDGKQHRIPLVAEDFMPRCYTFLKSPAGKPPRLAIGHYWGLSIFTLDAQRGPILARKCVGHQGEVLALSVLPEANLLVTASRDQTVCGWSLDDWPGQAELGAAFQADGDRIRVVSVEPGSPAWEAKLHAGDTIGMFAYGGRQVDGGPAAWLDVLRAPQPGRQCYFGKMTRDGQAIGDRLTTVRQRPIWRFFPMADREWVIWRHQDYFYDTSTNGDFFIGWQVSREVDETPTFYKTEQFRVRFHQPDRIAETLAGGRRSEDESIPRIEPPKVKLTVVKNPGVDAGITVSMLATARGDDDMQKLQRMVLWVNEHVVHEETFALPTGQVERTHIEILPSALRSGPNRITVQAYNQLELRDQATDEIDYERPKTGATLHGLLVGLSDYTKTIPKMGKLSGSEDVAGVESLWRAQEGKQFHKASLVVLRDQEATRDRIMRAFETLRREVKADDVLLLYLAGHGLASDQILNDPTLTRTLQSRGLPDYKAQGVRSGMFFFVPSNFDIYRPMMTGVTDDAMYSEIRKLPCRKIILLDACRSGTLRNSDPIRKLAPSGVGPVIISACEPHQSAVEAPDAQAEIWVEGQAKGLFAISLLKGLTSKFQFEADGNTDGVVNAAELVDYTKTEVPKLLNKLLFGRRDPMTEQYPSAFLPDLERLLPVARREPQPVKP